MEPHHPISRCFPPNSPSEFIYESKSRSHTPMPLGAVGLDPVSVAPPSRPFIDDQPLGHQSAGSPASFVPYYNPPKFAEPWEPIRHNQCAHPTTPPDRARPSPFAHTYRPINFREPYWGPRLSSELAMDPEHLMPRIVELEKDEGEPSAYDTAARDASMISPKSKVCIFQDHNTAKSKGHGKCHVASPAQGLNTSISPASRPVANPSAGSSPAFHTLCPPARLVQTTLPITPPDPQNPSTPLTAYSAWDDDGMVTDFSSPGDETWTFTDMGNVSGSGNQNGSAASQANIPSWVDRDAVKQAEIVEKICLEATKAYLRAHIANFRARACTTHMCSDHSSVDAVETSIKEEANVLEWEDDSTEAIRDRGSPVQRSQKSGSSVRFRPYPMSAWRVPYPVKDPFWSRPPQRRAPAPEFDISGVPQTAPLPYTRLRTKSADGSRKRKRLALAAPDTHPAASTSHTGSFAGAGDSDILGLNCTDSLLANTTSICNLVWQKAARNRLVSLNAEIKAVVKMHRLLEAAETVVFESGILRSVVKSAGGSACLSSKDAEEANHGAQDEENGYVIMRRIVQAANKMCAILEYEKGEQALKEIQK